MRSKDCHYCSIYTRFKLLSISHAYIMYILFLFRFNLYLINVVLYFLFKEQKHNDIYVEGANWIETLQIQINIFKIL